MEFTHVKLSENNTKSNLTQIRVPTQNPFRPDISGCEDSLKQIYGQLRKDAVVCLPEYLSSSWQKELKTLQGNAQCGLIYISTSLAVILDLDIEHTTLEGVLFDVCIMLSDRPVQVLTVVDSNLKWDSDIIERNEALSKAVLYSLRDYTDARFNLLYGVMTIDDVQDPQQYQSEMTRIEQSGHYINPKSLAMTPKKCISINKAFLTATAIQHDRDDSSQCVMLKLMEKDQYDIIQKNIDKERVIVEFKSQKNADILLAEVARRLSRSGKTCIHLKSGPKTDGLRSDNEPSTELIHHLTNIDDPSELGLLDTIGHIWMFVEDSSVTTDTGNSDGETLCGVCTLEREVDDVTRLALSLVDRKILLPDLLQDLKGPHKWNTFWRSVNFAKAQREQFIVAVASYSGISAEKLKLLHEGEFSCVCDRKRQIWKGTNKDNSVEPPEADLEPYHPDLPQTSTILLEKHLAVQPKRKNSMIDMYFESLVGHLEENPESVSTYYEMECGTNSKRNSSVSFDDSALGSSAVGDRPDETDV